jgi:hypothetical protein
MIPRLELSQSQILCFRRRVDSLDERLGKTSPRLSCLISYHLQKSISLCLTFCSSLPVSFTRSRPERSFRLSPRILFGKHWDQTVGQGRLQCRCVFGNKARRRRDYEYGC